MSVELGVNSESVTQRIEGCNMNSNSNNGVGVVGDVGVSIVYHLTNTTAMPTTLVSSVDVTAFVRKRHSARSVWVCLLFPLVMLVVCSSIVVNTKSVLSCTGEFPLNSGSIDYDFTFGYWFVCVSSPQAVSLNLCVAWGLSLANVPMWLSASQVFAVLSTVFTSLALSLAFALPKAGKSRAWLLLLIVLLGFVCVWNILGLSAVMAYATPDDDPAFQQFKELGCSPQLSTGGLLQVVVIIGAVVSAVLTSVLRFRGWDFSGIVEFW